MKQVIIMAMLAAGLMLAGCSKSESENMETGDNSGNAVLVEKLTKEIKQHIVGTWVCDGLCDVDYNEFFFNPAPSQLVVDDVAALGEFRETSFNHTFIFTDDGKATLYIPASNEYEEDRTYHGDFTVEPGGLTPDGNTDPPMCLKISYKDGNPGGYDWFCKILFSKDYRQMFLLPRRDTDLLRRYSLQ